jgi:hypothetical protein
VFPLVILRDALSVVGRRIFHFDPDSLVALRAIELTGFVPILNVELLAAMRAGSVETHYTTSKPFAVTQTILPLGSM